MTLANPFSDIPGTTVFDARMARLGYGLNQFCQSLMQADNRARFKADERGYLERWPMSSEQKQAVLARDLNRCIALGGNIFFLVKLGATDGVSVQKMVSTMSGMSEDDYRQMMIAGGRSPLGNRSLLEQAAQTAQAAQATQAAHTSEQQTQPAQPAPAADAAPCVVLLTGLLCDAAVWREQCQALAPARCIVPSYGELDSISAMAHSVLAAVPDAQFSLAGHSMGGRVALEIARLAPQRVLRLALLDTGMDAIAAGEAGEQERSKRLALLALAQREGMRRMGAQWAAGMVHPTRLDTPLFGEILEMIERQTPAIFAAQIHALLTRPDARAVLAGLRCPTLLLCGRQDAWSPLSRHQQMQALCPQAVLTVVEDSGHMSTMEQPAAVSAALAGWLATH